MPNFVQDLAASVRAYCEAHGESDHAFALRIDMLPQNFYDFMRRAKDDNFDPGRLRLEKLAAGAKHRIMVIPADLVPDVEALLARQRPVLPDSAPIAALELSARSSRVLAGVSVETVGDLCSWTAEQLLATPGFGPGSLKEVEMVLAAYGRRLEDGS
jgi:hypothetical protein